LLERHGDRPVDRQIETPVDDEIVLADGVVAVEPERIVRAEQANARATEHAVRSRIVHVSRELLGDDAHVGLTEPSADERDGLRRKVCCPRINITRRNPPAGRTYW
jgi:hypothetical protein